MHYSAWKEPEKRRNWGIPTQQLLTDSTRTYDECSRAIAEGLALLLALVVKLVCAW